MRRLIWVALTALLCLSCTGCSITSELENQAYVLVLGLDRGTDGSLEFTVRVPRIGGQDMGSKDGSAAKDEKYMVFSACGQDYIQALEALQWATPRRMNLSHIEMIVASETLAREPGFGDLIDQIAEIPHLYTTAHFVICAGKTRSFIESEQVNLGTRLSSDIEATLAHYASQGYIPKCCFADAYYRTCSVYSDPVAIHAYTAQTVQPTVSTVNPEESDLMSTPVQQRFNGTALMRDGTMVGSLDIDQTRLLNLIQGDSKSVVLSLEHISHELTATLPVEKKASVENGMLHLKLSFQMKTSVPIDMYTAAQLERRLKDAATALVTTCQRLKVDPFGFAEEVVRFYATVHEWLSCGWREHFSKADVEIQVIVRN